MENYRRPRDVTFPTPGPVPEYIRKATIKRIIQQQQEERLKRESNTSENSSQVNNNVALQQEKESGNRTVTVTKTATSLEINGIDHNKKINGHSNSQEINSGENEDQMLIDHKDDELEKDPLNPNENISNNKNNNESTREIILSLQDQESL